MSLKHKEDTKDIVKNEDVNSELENQDIKVKVTKKTLNSVSRRILLFENSVNFERMQSLAYTYTMIPVIKQLYKKKEDRKQALQRHLEFFNSNVSTASLITGVSVAMEEQKANGKPITDESINAVKSGLMGPASGIGDALFWGTFVPIVGGIAASMGQDGSIFAPIFHQVVRVGVYIAMIFMFVRFGYGQGMNLFQYAGHGAVKKITVGAKILAAIVIGGLVASLVHAQTGITFGSGESETTLQGVFDQILPNLLPLSIFGLLFYLLNKRKWSPILLILFVFLLGLGASYFNILTIGE